MLRDGSRSAPDGYPLPIGVQPGRAAEHLDVLPFPGARDTRRIGRRAVLCALGVATLTACGPGNGKVDLSATDTAVMAACARVVSVLESRSALDGLGTGLHYKLRFDSKRPASVDDLDAIAAAIWQNSPFEPNGITLTAFADEAQEEPVDLRVAAAGLEPVRFQAFGQGGVSLLGMWKRYGDWDDPT